MSNDSDEVKRAARSLVGRSDLFTTQDDLLVALSSNPARFGIHERATLRLLPPWRAVMLARIATACGLMEQAELDALVDEARAVGGTGMLT